MKTTVGQQRSQKKLPNRLFSSFSKVGQAWRFPLLAAAILTLLGAIWGGWIRMGWQFPVLQPTLVGAHGSLMVSGFFGTLISLERAVAMRRGWPYLGPSMGGLGAILFLLGVGGSLPGLLLVASSIWLVLIFAAILRQHRTRYLLVMAAGSLAWAVGNLFWIAGWPVYRVVLWWAAFLILTIAGERLELGRLVRHSPRVERMFTAAIGLFLGGLILALFSPNLGTRLASLSLVGLSAWLLRFDIARWTVHKAGLPRFAAICLLSGYAWLAVAGLLGLRFGAVPAGFLYDAFLHAIFLGFTFAMIFAHAPIIFPAILGLPIVFNRSAYLPLILLHLSLALRIAGDLLFLPGVRMWGGMLNGITILIFLALTGNSIRAGMGKRQKETAAAPFRTEEENRAAITRQSQQLQGLWLGSLAAFILAALSGSLMRWWMMAGFPAGIQFINVRHAHSHLMYFAWVTPALMALIAARLPGQTGRAAPRGMLVATGLALAFGLFSFLPFFLAGYEPLILGSRRWPLSIVFSSLNILAWYGYMVFYRKTTRDVGRSRPVKLWNAALAFLFAASLGAWGRALLGALNIEDSFLSSAAVHLFLDLFSSGWAVLGLLGLLYSTNKLLAKTISGWEDHLLLLGLPPSFLLGMPVDLVPVDLRTLSGIGGMMAATGLFLHGIKLWPFARTRFWSGWGLPLALLLLKAGMDVAAVIPALARWSEQMGLRILYLHTLLLGFVTLGLVVAGLKLWEAQTEPDQPQQGRLALRWLSWTILVLLGSLLPLTGLWPAPLGGEWRLVLSFVVSPGPAIAAAVLLIQKVTKTRWMYNRKGVTGNKQQKAQPLTGLFLK